jgi:serine phosphatase RsbU (regulator of sigma subunit)
MSEIESLTDQWRRSCAGDAWHGPSLSALLGEVEAGTAAAHPIEGAHSIWEIVLHLAAWTGEVARRLEGGAPAMPEGGDWPAPDEAHAEGWRRALESLVEAQARGERALRGFPEERLSERVGGERDAPLGTGVSYRAMIEGALQHNAYHGGQIVLLTRACRAAHGLEDEHRRRAERLEREIAIARRIQSGLFPEKAPSGPDWEAAAQFRPARELGGDLYDFYELWLDRSGAPTGARRLGVAVGDVAGKGMPAALYGAFASGTVRARAFEGHAPDALLARVNRTLHRRGVEGLYCCLTYALFDFDAGRLRVAGSGLPYPLHYRAAEGACFPIEVAGLPLGTFERSVYEALDLPLAAGDVLVFATDGVTEARREEEEYGAARLRRLLEATASLPAQAIGERVLADLDAFVGASAPPDDITLVVVKVLEPTAAEGKDR